MAMIIRKLEPQEFDYGTSCNSCADVSQITIEFISLRVRLCNNCARKIQRSLNSLYPSKLVYKIKEITTNNNE